MARTFTVDLSTQTYYLSHATGKSHLMNAKHAERIIAARDSKPVYANPNGEGGEHDFDDYTRYLNSAAYRAYERAYRLALAEARVICTQRQTRVYHTPNGVAVAGQLPADLCVKCASHLAS